MSAPQDLAALVDFSRELGRPELDYVILGEGNTSLVRDEQSFWVKASGRELHMIDASGFVAVRFAPVLEMLDGGDGDAPTIKQRLAAAVCDGGTGVPSIEVALHALALTLGGARAAGHTHPTPLMAILCSANARAAADGRLFPDEVIVCGRASAYVPYAHPGLPLAQAVREALIQHRERWHAPPRVILLENHGLIALGQTPGEVLRVTAMCVKAARVLQGTWAMGGPRFLQSADVERLAGRTGEPYRGRIPDGEC